MTPERRKAEIERLRGRYNSLDESYLTCECFEYDEGLCLRCEDDAREMLTIKAQLAALEAEVGHDSKEKQDGEA